MTSSTNADRPIRPRRSALFLPASNPRAIARARTIGADVVILDLEDAVAPEAKDAARDLAIAAVNEGGFGDAELVIRANALDSPWGAADLAAIAGSAAAAALVPKVASAADITRYDAALTDAAPAMQLWVMIESCGAVLRLDAIGAMAATTRLSAWMVGTNDLARDMHARPGPDRAVFIAILAQAVAAGRAHGLVVFDGVCNNFSDLAVFRAEAEQGLMLGFDGKSLIHPDQVAPCNAVFAPGAAELAGARALIDAFTDPANAGKGAIRVGGKMAELLHLDEARRVIAMAEAIARRG